MAHKQTYDHTFTKTNTITCVTQTHNPTHFTQAVTYMLNVPSACYQIGQLKGNIKAWKYGNLFNKWSPEFVIF